MTLIKRISNGITLGYNDTTNTTYTTLANVVKMISGPSAKAETVKLDLMADIYDTKSRGSVDPGQVKFDIAYDPTDGNSTKLASLLGSSFATLASGVPSWKLTYPAVGTNSAQTETFSGFVAGLDRKAEKNNMVSAEITIEVSGDPGFPTS